MGKKRKIMSQAQKFASKYGAHPALAANKAEALATKTSAEATTPTSEATTATPEATPATTPVATPEPLTKEAPKAKKVNPFKKLTKKTTTKKTDKE